MTTKIYRLGLVVALAAAGCHSDLGIPDYQRPDAGGGYEPPQSPETTVTAMGSAITNQRSVTFELTANQPGARFKCSVTPGYEIFDDDCASPYTVTVTSDGTYQLEVAAITDSYRRDLTPAKVTWQVDTVPPRQTTISGPSAVDNSPAPSIFFSAESGTTAKCFLDARPGVTCTSPYNAPPLVDGQHSFSVVATDAAGNAETHPPAVFWVLDTTPSDTVIASGPTGVVNANRQVFTFSSPDAPAGSTFRCKLDDADRGICASPYTLDFLNDGFHMFSVQVVEPTGGVDPTPATRSFTVDTVPPGLFFTTFPSLTTNDNTPTFAFTVDPSAVATECRVGAAAFAACTSPVTLAAQPDGATTFEVRARDAAGNAGTTHWTFTIDTAPPVVTFTGGPGELSNNPSPTFQFTAPGAISTSCQINEALSFSCASPRQIGLGSGTFTFTVRATDAAGNVGTASQTFTIDTTAPSLSLTGPSSTARATPTYTFTTDATGTLSCSLDGAPFAACSSPVTTAALGLGNHTFTVHATDAAGNVASRFQTTFVDPRALSVAIATGPFGEISDRSPAITWTSTGALAETCRYDAASFGFCGSALATPLADGPHTFEVKVTNDLGGVQSATRSFIVDTVAPLATITAGPTGTVATPSVTFAFTTSGAPTVTECRLLPNGMGNGPYAPCTSPASFELAAAGGFVFEVRVRDAAGNQWSAYREFAFAP